MSKHRLFRFKNFNVDHSRSAMKVGTDGVLLGAWADVTDARQILDIGTGSGVIALMLAQRTADDVQIDAVEMEAEDAAQAIENISNSPWPGKIIVHHSSIQSFATSKKYDLIVSNPPFFINSFHPPDPRRIQVRHATSLSQKDLLNAVLSLLHETGKFNIILPAAEGETFVNLAGVTPLHVSRKTLFRGRASKPPERWLLEFTRQHSSVEENELVMYDGDEWSVPYRRLTRDFYLKA
jgi:tRNA1Val (adenine37-N6)-methyltransferase